MAPETLNEHLVQAVAVAGGLNLLDREERVRRLAWSEVFARSQATANGLVALGLEPGERVALLFPTGEAFFDAFFGTLLAGGVPTPLYPPVRLGHLGEYHRRTARMIELAGSPLVLADRRVRRLLGETVAPLSLRLGCRLLEDLPVERTAELPRVGPEDLALVQFSSGTTAEPKPVALSHRAILAQVDCLNASWPEGAAIRHTGVSWLPLYHDMGLIGCVFAALALATDLTLLPPEHFVARPALWLRAISRFRATVSPAPNFAYSLCVQRIRDEEMEGVDLSSWRVALNGAEPVAPSVLRAFSERFARWGLRPEALTPVYGLAEAALAVTFSDVVAPYRSRRFDRAGLTAEPGRAEEAPDGLELVSLGRPLAGFALEIRDEERHPLPAGRVGRLWVRGPSLMEGYLDQQEATEAALVDGWLDTGDLGFLADGELYLSGRAKDMLLIRGKNLSPQAVEAALEGLPGARPGCAVAASHLPEGADSEVLVLLVETRRDVSEEEKAALPRHCRDAVLAAVGVAPGNVVLLEPGTLPRTSSGKLRRQDALRRYLAGELAAPRRVTALYLLAAMGRSFVAFLRSRGRRAGGRR